MECGDKRWFHQSLKSSRFFVPAARLCLHVPGQMSERASEQVLVCMCTCACRRESERAIYIYIYSTEHESLMLEEKRV